MQIKSRKVGFTLIELSLAMVFISVLSIIVVVMINNAISSYHKGLVLNQINTVGMDVVDDIRTTVQGSPAELVTSSCMTEYNEYEKTKKCQDDNAMSFIFAERYGNVRIKAKNEVINVPLYGVVCTGNYSYIWNSGYWFNTDDYEIASLGVRMTDVKYKTIGSDDIKTAQGFKLLKIQDEERLACKNATRAASGNDGYMKSRELKDNLGASFDVTGNSIDADPGPTDLLQDGGLALYDLTVALPADSVLSNNVFYAMSFILGTVQGGINVAAMGNYCAAPEDESNSGIENFDYCAINKFNFAAQAAGE